MSLLNPFISFPKEEAGAAVEYIGGDVNGNSNYISGNSTTLNYPAEMAEGDLVVIINATMLGNTRTPSLPSGFTSQYLYSTGDNNDAELRVCTRIATAGDLEGSIVCGSSGGVTTIVAVMMVFRNAAEPTTANGNIGSVDRKAASTSSYSDAPSISINPTSMLMCWYTYDESIIYSISSAPSGMTEAQKRIAANSTAVTYYEPAEVSNPTGLRRLLWSNSGGERLGIQIEIPAAA